MEIIKDNIEEIMREINYIYKEKYPDGQLNNLYNYWNFFNGSEEELRAIKNISLETVLYSKYYWFSRFADRFHDIYGFDAGIDQQGFMIIEEMDQKLEEVNWFFMEGLHHEKTS